ncbi:hypothetical protein DPEC_G00284580 [Dallia pectoralis]|uniref:Uncharacterized protein n=1 Tax=Dallia pectoralis TaxID=75939 RepID=A0ACC2FJE5_DALPE|nr:hypothetical protein DPEC_G00284580 [Dallia pectoralis]
MKTSKSSSSSRASAQECGVWLDTSDIKEKAKQKIPFRPISKLLNPLAKSGGYSLAVALNFTQTKTEMPVTKQSSISSFFTAHRKVTAKTSASPVPIRTALSVTPFTSNMCSSTSPIRANIGSGTKRKRAVEWTGSQGTAPPTTLHSSPGGKENEPAIPPVWDNQTFRERLYWESEFMPHLNLDRSSKDEMEEPAKKKRLSVKSSSPVGTGAHGKDCNQDESSTPFCSPQWTQDQTEPGDGVSWDVLTHDSEGPSVLTHQATPICMSKTSDTHTGLPESLQSEGRFRALLGSPGNNSTQRGSVQSSLMSQEENDSFLSACSLSSDKIPLSPVSIHRQMKRCPPSPWEHVLEQPLTRVLEQPCREAQEDALTMLFTQDSEGFRVIAHRAVFPQSPLKDRTNVLASGIQCILATDQMLQESEEEEILFTQDSQGNKVIKH